MSDKTFLGIEREDTSQSEPFYVDGCKVTVHYSEGKKPDVIRGIRNILLSGAKVKRS